MLYTSNMFRVTEVVSLRENERWQKPLGNDNKEQTEAVKITNEPAGAVGRIKGTPGRVDKV